MIVQRCDQPIDHRRAQEWAGRVMDQDAIEVRPERLKPRQH